MQAHQKKKTLATATPVTTPVVTIVQPNDPSMPSLTPVTPSGGAGTPAPVTPSSPVVLSTTPPVLDIPVPPAGSSDAALGMYRGCYPQAAEIAALPDAITELSSSTSYTSLMGPGAPALAPFITNLQNAAGWATLRASLEAYLAYTTVQEGTAWKAASKELDQVKAVMAVVMVTNAAVATTFPALERLLAARALPGKMSAASRKRTKAQKAKSAAAAPTATATTPSATTVPANLPAVSTTGGGQH